MFSLLVFFVTAANAAQLMIDDPNCKSWELSGTAPNQVAKCTTTPKPPDPPPVWNGNCAGYNNTITVNMDYVAKPRPKVVQQDTRGETFANGNIIVVKFRTPAAGKFESGGNGGSIAVIHYPGPNATRTAVLSKTPCDFAVDGKNKSIADGPTINFSSRSTNGYFLQPDTTYYFNVKNKTATGADSCGANNCPVQVTLSPR